MKLQTCLLLPPIAIGLSALAGAQATTVFSVDWHGPTIAVPDSFTATPITAGDLLTTAPGTPLLGPMPVPGTYWSHTMMGLLPGCVGLPPGTPCPVEVDALSFGFDFPPSGPQGFMQGELHFSVDSHASGVPGSPLPPNVALEFIGTDASADVMTNFQPYPAGPMPPGPPLGHRGILDGDGLASATGFTYPGLGLVEPAPPLLTPVSIGDNLDAVDTILPGQPNFGVYFSLEGGLVDPINGIPGSGSAAAHGFTGADVLFSPPGGPPMMYAPGGALGLNVVPGLVLDDLDAMILWENGDGVYQPSQMPMDWFGGGTDMLLFSVRRGSAVIGMPDSIFGIPIQEGDILTTPFVNGLSPFPGIFYAQELLELASVRSGTAISPFSDDLNALDVSPTMIKDCDFDGVEDVVAIAMGVVPDADWNGVPDGCRFASFCSPAAPNSTGLPTLLWGTLGGGGGTGVHLESTQGPPNRLGYFLVGTGAGTPFGISQGFFCLALTPGNLGGRYNVAGTPMNSVGIYDPGGVLQNFAGTSTVGSGFDIPLTLPNIGGVIVPGSTYHFQVWHREAAGASNFSNGLSVMF